MTHFLNGSHRILVRWIRTVVIPHPSLVVLLFLALSCGHARPAWSMGRFQTEAIKFLTNVVPGTTNDKKIEIKATLYIAESAQYPLPVVVIAPSSGGVEEEREIYYSKQLAKAGIAALIVDSFSSRGLRNSIYDQSKLEQWDIENDAVAALEELAADKRFLRDKIAILGVSKGGTVAMDTALTIRRQWMGIEDVAFAAHIAISPDCTWLTRRADTTGAPILFMLAELDDQTPAQSCLAQAGRIRNAGNERVETKIYQGAHHAWEELGRTPEYDPKAENYSRCRVWIEDGGEMVSADTGETLPEDDWHSWAKKNCMTLGTTCCGGNRKLKREATQDIISFLRKYGF